MNKTTRSFVIVTAAAALALAGCSNSKDDSKASETSTTVKATTTTKETTTAKETTTEEAGHDSKADASHGEFHLHDGYVKAAKAGGMTAIFGMLENHADKPAHLVGFTTSVDAKMNQIHEVVDGKMQEKKDGIIIPADGQHILKPGGDHLMLMGLPSDVEAGSTITVTLKFEDGSSVTVKDVPVRQMAAGNEDYKGDDHAGHEGHQKDGEHKMDGMTMAPETTAATQ